MSRPLSGAPPPRLVPRRQSTLTPVPNLHALDGDPLGEQFQPWWAGDGPDLQILTPHGMGLMQALDKAWLKDHAEEPTPTSRKSLTLTFRLMIFAHSAPC
jgi:hypothetical protein